ncbi:hypothetical protein Tco_0889268 [Tanacetum coccineum]
MTSFNQRECKGCGQPCDGFYCYLCTCQQCGVKLINGICLNRTYGDGKPVTCCGCEGPLNGEFCSFCASRAGNSFAYDPNSFSDSPDFPDSPPQPQYESYSYELCGNDAHFGYDCPTQVSFIYNPEPCYNQDFDNDFPQNEVIKSSVEDLVPIPSESEGISDDTCDVPFYENSHPLDALKDHSEIFFDPNDDYASSDDDPLYSEDIDYIDASPPDSELVSLEEVKDFDTEDGEIDIDILLTIKDDFLRERLMNINLLIAKIEALKDNPTPSTDSILKSPSSFPNSFFEKSDTSLSYSNNSLPEFKIFSNHTKETSSGSTTTHADNSLPEYDSFSLEI